MSKKALLVGINNFTPGIPALRGCINDTRNMQTLLQNRFGFAAQDVKVLNDADANWANIKAHLTDWLISGSKAGDVRVFHFSSHGTQVADQPDGDEIDGSDEVIVPFDHDWNNPVRDDYLKEIFDAVPSGVNMTVIMDTCHSGTITRRLQEDPDVRPRYVAPPPEISQAIRELRKQREAEISAEAAAELAQALQQVPQDQWAKLLAEKMGALIQRKRQNRYGLVNTKEKCILLAACQDRQTSADAFIEGTYQGAFTYSLVKAVTNLGSTLTYDQLIRATANNLSRYTQTAQLECPGSFRFQQIFEPISV